MSLRAHPLFLEGVEHHKAGRFDEAGRLYQQLLEEHSDDPDLWHFKGLLALHKGQAAEATRLITLALVLKPEMPEYLQNLAQAHEAAAQPVQAADAYNKLGNALQVEGRYSDALAAYDRSLAFAPDIPSVIINRGAALDRLGRYSEAAQAFETALDLLEEPAEAELLLNKANALSGLGRSREAIAVYDRVLALTPNNAAAHCSRGLLALRLGDMKPGWRDYEWRWQPKSGFREGRGHFRQPVWQGETAEELGGPLLVIAEQGLGDVIQFARYVPLLAERGYDVIFEALPELVTLFREGFEHPRLSIVPRVDTPLAIEGGLAFAAWVGVMSLPDRFGTTITTVPADVPYLKVDVEKVARWKTALLPFSSGKKVGLVWAGNPKYPNDLARSIPAEALAPLLAMRDVEFYSLQKGPAVRQMPQGVMIDLGEKLGDFTETAAAILSLDLVISVDTSVAHLAGALGKPVWLLIPAVCDWRWMNQGDTSVWYPTMRLFRQTVRGDWSDVIERVVASLKTNQ